MMIYVLAKNPYDSDVGDYGDWHLISAFTDQIKALQALLDTDEYHFLMVTKDGEKWNHDEVTIWEAERELAALTQG